jgi:hypothetical protein
VADDAKHSDFPVTLANVAETGFKNKTQYQCLNLHIDSLPGRAEALLSVPCPGNPSLTVGCRDTDPHAPGQLGEQTINAQAI